MTPDPWPYGKDLISPAMGFADDPRARYVNDMWRELQAANGEVLALRAERDALLADMAGVLGREAALAQQVERLSDERYALREVVEAVRALALSAPDTAEMSGLPGSFTPVRDAVEDFAIQVCDLLPTPTGDDG